MKSILLSCLLCGVCLAAAPASAPQPDAARFAQRFAAQLDAAEGYIAQANSAVDSPGDAAKLALAKAQSQLDSLILLWRSQNTSLLASRPAVSAKYPQRLGELQTKAARCRIAIAADDTLAAATAARGLLQDDLLDTPPQTRRAMELVALEPQIAGGEVLDSAKTLGRLLPASAPADDADYYSLRLAMELMARNGYSQLARQSAAALNQRDVPIAHRLAMQRALADDAPATAPAATDAAALEALARATDKRPYLAALEAALAAWPAAVVPKDKDFSPIYERAIATARQLGRLDVAARIALGAGDRFRGERAKLAGGPARAIAAGATTQNAAAEDMPWVRAICGYYDQAAALNDEQYRRLDPLTPRGEGYRQMMLTADERMIDFLYEVGSASEFFDAVELAKARVAADFLRQTASPASRPATAAAAVAEIRTALEQLAREPQRQVRPQTVLLPRLQKALGDDECVLEFYIGPSSGYAMLIERANCQRRRLSASPGELAGAVAAWHEAARGGGSAQAAAQKLMAELVGDWATSLENKKVLVVPCGVLWYVPAGAWQDAGGKYLIEKAALRTAPSATLAVRLMERKPAPDAPAILSDAAGAVTRAAFVKDCPQATLIHIARSPAGADASPFGGVALADGRLGLTDLMGLKLKANLVMLTGCGGRWKLPNQSAGGVEAAIGCWGEEAAALPSALAAGGAGSVLWTCWPADDAAGRMIVADFLAGRAKLGGAAALREAQLKALKNPATAHPVHWAGFYYTGGAGQ